MQLDDINSKPHGVKIHRDLIYHFIVTLLYPKPGSEHKKILRLDRFNGSTNRQVKLNDKPDKK